MITTQEAMMAPDPGDEHYQPSRVERLKRWISLHSSLRKSATEDGGKP